MSKKLHASIILTYRCNAKCNMCDVVACNGMDEKMPMGNLKEQSWDEIWNSKRAQEVRQAVKDCKKNCWMIAGYLASSYKAGVVGVGEENRGKFTKDVG